MRISPAGLALLVATGFAGGIAAAPGNGLLARQFGIAPAAARGSESQDSTYSLLTLFGNVFDQVRADYVEPVTDRKLIQNALNGMLSGLDPHSSYLSEQEWHDMQSETAGHFGGIGLEVTDNGGVLEVVSPIDDTPASHAGLKAGDLITALDGKSIVGLSLNEAVNQMRGPPDTTLQLTVKRAGQPNPLLFTLRRQVIHVQNVTSKLMGDVGVIRISEFNEQADPGFRDALKKLRAEAGGRLRGLILDLRNNPGGLLDQAVAVSNDFLDQGGIVSTRGRHPQDDQAWYAHPNGDVVGRLPVVVLVNNGTASAAEIVSGALQDDRRAVVLGTQTFGKGSVQTLIPMPGNGAIRLTTARYYTPSGRSIQGLGITPNVVVDQTDKPAPHFGPAHESDLLHILTNAGSTNAAPPPPPVPLPAVAQQIQKLPPPGWPAYDKAKPSTDYQLQQGLFLVRAMAQPQAASR